MKKIIIGTIGLMLWVNMGAANLLKSHFDTQSLTSSVMTNDYWGVSLQAGDVVVMTAVGNKAPSTPVEFSGTAGTFSLYNTTSANVNPTVYSGYLTVSTDGTYDFHARASGAIWGYTALYVLRADSKKIRFLASAQFAVPSASADDQTLSYDWDGTSVSNAIAIEAVAGETKETITPNNVSIDGGKIHRILCSGTFSGTTFASTYSFPVAMKSSGVGLAFSEASADPAPPEFNQDPLRKSDALTGNAYSDSLANDATDLNEDELTFLLASGGPAWLTLAPDGTLSGTPSDADKGTNTWTVLVTDGISGTNSATLEIVVNDSSADPLASAYNVLFIAIDDINPIIGCYGNKLIKTPNIDRLAAHGMLFANAHCQWSVCGPSRASLMTGLMPEQEGVMGFTKMRGMSADGNRDNLKGVTNIVTLAQHFKNQGFETAAVGKINDHRCVGSINPDGTINEDGDSVDDPPSWSYGFANPLGVGSTTAIRTTDGKKVKLAAESVDQPATDFTDGKIATDAIAYLHDLADGDKPFFLGVGFKKPHLPFLAPKSSWDLYQRDDFSTNAFPYAMANVTPYTFNNVHELRDSYFLETDAEGNALPLTEGILPEEQQKTLNHGYYACISHVDEQVGRVLDELDALGLTSNTIIVLWGDHGFHLGDHNEWGKHSNLEQATHMPLIISVPGYPQGLKSTSPVGLVDLFPTLCDLLHLPLPEQPPAPGETENRPLVGHSLKPILLDPNVEVQTGIMNHYGSSVYGYAYRTDRYRYTEWIDSSRTIKARELYDYKLDPMETVNLAVYPEYQALMYQFSRSMREASECRGCDRMKASPVMPEPENLLLTGLSGVASNGTFQLHWPDAAGSTYNILITTNLIDAVWTTNFTGVVSSPYSLPTTDTQSFFRVELSN